MTGGRLHPPGADAWAISVAVPASAVAPFEAALEQISAAVALAEGQDAGLPDGQWRITGYTQAAPDPGAIAALLAVAGAAAGIQAPKPETTPLAARDWLADSLASFRPVRAGRFQVRGSHVSDPPPAGSHVLVVDAATAFGSGEHATTRGCLLAMDDHARRHRPRSVLDMGCGSGVLALAAARRWRVPVLAVDLDAEAVRVTRANARANRLDRLVRARAGNGYRAVPPAERFDLIVSNILARPLARMAPATARHLAPGGTVVLAGLLARQEASVLAAHRASGLALCRRYLIDGWSILVLRWR